MDRFEKDTNLEPLKLSCIKCNGTTWHEVMTSISHRYSEESSNYTFEANTDHQLVKCRGCLSITYLSSSTNSEDIDFDEDGNPYCTGTTEMYPPRLLKSRIEEHDLFSIPDQARKLLLETRGALANNYPILTGIGLRGLIETVAKAKGAKGGVLLKKIDDLVEQRILTPERAKILHEIRTIGNAAAHEAKPHTTQQLNLALEVIEHVLQEVYVLPKKAERVFAKSEVTSPTSRFEI